MKLTINSTVNILENKSTLLALKVEPCTSNGPIMKPILSAERMPFITDCTDQLSTQMSLQCIKMVNATLLNKELVIYFRMKGDQIKKAMKICNISPDGDCLFAAIVHQLNGEKIDSVSHKNSTAALKKEVIEYIKDNINTFEQFLKGRVLEYKSEKEIKDINVEFLAFLDDRLPKGLSWGGGETMKAVTKLHKVNIVVLNEDDGCKLGYRYNSEYNRSIILSYRDYNDGNGPKKTANHYDSVVEISEGALEKFTREAAEAECKYQSLTNKPQDSPYIIDDSD